MFVNYLSMICQLCVHYSSRNWPSTICLMPVHYLPTMHPPILKERILDTTAHLSMIRYCEIPIVHKPLPAEKQRPASACLPPASQPNLRESSGGSACSEGSLLQHLLACIRDLGCRTSVHHILFSTAFWERHQTWLVLARHCQKTNYN